MITPLQSISNLDNSELRCYCLLTLKGHIIPFNVSNNMGCLALGLFIGNLVK